MIRLELTTAVAIYTLVTVIGILSLWVFFGREKKATQYVSEKKNIWQCTICTYTYVDSRHEVISKCPQCGSLNKRK
jgi:reverse gyrase